MEKEKNEIEKLTERIAKDPKSKLFVPLAEEHKKAGNIDTAIRVLTEGLKQNPGYVTARSFLGRLLMDKGDLTGAQKELEEVIKTIPDNLLAQRKLGDIYVLQGRAPDALPRYKAALALNPGDKELPLLLADLEAGKDISSRIPGSKSPAAPAAMKPQPAPSAPFQPKATPAGALRAATTAPQTSAAAQKVPVAPGPPAARIGEPTITTAPPLPPASAAATPPVPPVPNEVEIIEDIVELESLDQTGSGSGTKVPSPDRFPAPAPFDLSEPLIEAESAGAESEAMIWEVAETAVSEPGVQAGTDEGSDDLNTNTLAELYISQGFYDKAIEIYQGMLNDRPGNAALLQKLEQIRAMAGESETAHERIAEASPGPGEYTPSVADVVTEVPTQTAAAPAVSPPVTDASTQKEMMPRERAPQMTSQEPLGESAPPRAPRAATTRRKETIDRLESWLNTIMKEKQE